MCSCPTERLAQLAQAEGFERGDRCIFFVSGGKTSWYFLDALLSECGR